MAMVPWLALKWDLPANGKTRFITCCRNLTVWRGHWEMYHLLAAALAARKVKAQILETEGVELLGGSLTTDITFATEVVQKRVNKCIAQLDTLIKLQDPQLCLLLLRACLGMRKLVYCWRTSPVKALEGPGQDMETALRKTLHWIVAANGPRFAHCHFHWASLPIDLGGLGILLPSDLSKFARLSSQMDTLQLQYKIFPGLLKPEKALQSLLTDFDASLSDFENGRSLGYWLSLGPRVQRELAASYFRSKRHRLMTAGHALREGFGPGPISPQHYHLFMVRAYPKPRDISGSAARGTNGMPAISFANQWLHANPALGFGLRMNPLEFRAAMYFRLMMDFFNQPSDCRNEMCDSPLDKNGYHSLSCGMGGSQRVRRHDAVVQAVCDIARSAQFHPLMEAQVRCLGTTSRGRGDLHALRPADLLIDGDNYRNTCVDVTVVSPLSAAKADSPDCRIPGYLAMDAAKTKVKKHEQPCKDAFLGFKPFAVDVCGMVDPIAYEMLERFATGIALHENRPYGYVLSYIIQRMSFAIQLGVARQLVPLLRLPRGVPAVSLMG
jgi:hypothetical protein